MTSGGDQTFPHNGGIMGDKVRAFDWAATPLGAIDTWPLAQKIVVDLILSNALPTCLFLGPDLIAIYNDAYIPLTGAKPESLGEPFRVTWAEVWDSMRPIAERAMGGEAVFFEDYMIPLNRFGEEEEAYFTFSYSPLRDENGRIFGIIDSVVETTGKVKAERDLRRERDNFTQLFEQAPTFMTLLRGPDHRFEYINPGYRRLIGGREVVGLTVAEGLPEIVEQGFVALLDRVYTSGEAFVANGVQVFLTGAGDDSVRERYLDFVYQPIVDADGKVSGIFVEGADVTERHQAEQASQQSRLQMEALTNALPQQVWTARPDGQLDYINLRTIDYAGDVPIIDGIVQWAGIVHPDDLERSIPIWLRSLETGEPYEAEQRIFHQASQTFRWNLSRALALRNPAGEIVRWIGTNTDIEDNRAAQQAMLDARNAAEAANIAKSEFLANMSHEIRTPMNAVIGLSTLLAKSAPLSPRQREFIKTLQMSADSLLALINDLLDIAKIEARTVELEHIPFSLTRIIQEVASMMAVPVRDKGLKFTGEGDCVENRVFLGDPTRLRQIITNLCSNAIKFTSDGGIHVAITCHDNDVPNQQTICIAVTDTGIGIAPDHIETIFQKFTQADSSINRKYGGTGLGLAITKTLAEIMGGTISLQSKLGVGSTFAVCIPLEIAPEQPDEGQPSMTEMLEFAIDSKTRALVLLVEDYEPNVLVARTFLEDFGYRVDVATNGLEAFEKVKTGRYLVVLMDVQMHGLNGLDATRMIRTHEQQHGRPRLPIIGMTAHALAGDRERCLGVGMDDYIAKPFNPDELRAKIKAFQG